MILAYNTNGLANHNLLDAIELVAESGYRGIAITIDHAALNPFDDRIEEHLAQVSDALRQRQMRCVIETGARFLLDPRTKHEPTLVTADPNGRAERVDFLKRSINIAARLGADCVSLWSGILRDEVDRSEAVNRLIDSLCPVIEFAEQTNVDLGFEPEPGMLVDTLDAYDQVLGELDRRHIDSRRLKLTLDIGHLHCQQEVPISEKIMTWQTRLVNVHIEDSRTGFHEHLMFGEGEINFPSVIAALAKIGYAGVLGVELSRHSHNGPAAVRQAYDFLQPLVADASG